jgi:hypothetical protein
MSCIREAYNTREFNYRMSIAIKWSTEQELFRTIKYLLIYTQSANITSLPLLVDYDAKAHNISHVTILRTILDP